MIPMRRVHAFGCSFPDRPCLAVIKCVFVYNWRKDFNIGITVTRSEVLLVAESALHVTTSLRRFHEAV